jgi:hypothetical protein
VLLLRDGGTGFFGVERDLRAMPFIPATRVAFFGFDHAFRGCTIDLPPARDLPRVGDLSTLVA